MKKSDFDKLLNRTIPNLQEFEPDKMLWERISSNLDFDIEVEKNISKLPLYSPDDKLWNKIDASINQRKNRRIRVIKLLRIPASIAASILFIVTVYFVLNRNNKTTLSRTEEFSTEWSNNMESNDKKRAIDPELFIEETCQKHSFICETKEFNEKSSLLNELNQNLQKINNEINSYGSSISLEKSKIKIENLKAQVVKDLIKQILS